jgi:hypothetical protein
MARLGYGALMMLAEWSLALQAATIVLLALFRVFLFSCMFGYVSAVFGFRSFGRISGIILCTGACTTFLSIPCLAWTIDGPGGGDYSAVNAVSLALAAVSLHMPLFLWRQQRAAGHASHAAEDGKSTAP